MRDRRAHRVVCMAGMLGMIIPGCDSGAGDVLPREPVSGTVKFDGQPLANGAITFPPKSAKAETPASAMIQNGSFSIPRASGPVPGTYTVTIAANAGAITKPGAAPGELTKASFPKEIIPAEYNTNSTLTKEVKAGGNNTFDFDLKK